MSLNEYQIASERVLPHLVDGLKWPSSLISKYGRVPVQVGSEVAWADYVFYIAWQNKPHPYLLVEVKIRGMDLEQCVPQGESYALMLGAPFFVITDGDKYLYFLAGRSQGDSIRLHSYPGMPIPVPIPSIENLPTNLDFISFPPELDPLVKIFLKELKEDKVLLRDTIWHSECLDYWNKRIFARLNEVTKGDLVEGVNHHMMKARVPVMQSLLRAIEHDFNKLTNVLREIQNIHADPFLTLDSLLEPQGDLHMKMLGPFVISQLLAAAHPLEFGVWQESIAKALKDLRMTPVAVKTGIANGYIYVNDICTRIYKEKFKSHVDMGRFGLAPGFELVTVHNFLWHYYEYYKKGKSWGGQKRSL